MLKLLALPWFYGARQPVRTALSSRAFSQCPVHPDLMKVLVCPLSKEPLRYEASTNELVCDKLGVAYPVLEGGIPNLVPEDGRLLHSDNAMPAANNATHDNINQTPGTTESNKSNTISVNQTHSEPQT